ncbi:MAG: hypothetical protein HYR94_20435 [Chloroflexi bacterium]|nr:hypothetical protein [Chloroflexota bacterium]
MSKRKDKKQTAVLYESVARLAGRESSHLQTNHTDLPISDEILAASKALALVLNSSPHLLSELRKMKKFRFQLLHRWMLAHLEPCRVADVGGGKGLLTYLLRLSGWPATVIDPHWQALPTKFKDLGANKQVHLAASETVPRINQRFDPAMAQDFDLLVALHAHGCNIQLIDAAARFNRCFIILPCCIIHEPISPPAGVHWLQCVVDYAVRLGFTVEPFRLNFKGQNIGLYGYNYKPTVGQTPNF